MRSAGKDLAVGIRRAIDYPLHAGGACVERPRPHLGGIGTFRFLPNGVRVEHDQVGGEAVGN